MRRFYVYTFKECPKCKGSGTVGAPPEEDDCTVCEGGGEVKRLVPMREALAELLLAPVAPHPDGGLWTLYEVEGTHDADGIPLHCVYHEDGSHFILDVVEIPGLVAELVRFLNGGTVEAITEAELYAHRTRARLALSADDVEATQ